MNLHIKLPRIPIVLLTRKHSRHNSTLGESSAQTTNEKENKRTFLHRDRFAQEEHGLLPVRWLAQRSRAKTCHPVFLESRSQARTALGRGLASYGPDLCEYRIALLDDRHRRGRTEWCAGRREERVKVEHECVDLGSFGRCARKREGGFEVKLAGGYRAEVQVLYGTRGQSRRGYRGIGYLDDTWFADDRFDGYHIDNRLVI